MNINVNNYYGNKRITTALLLAAGTGSRLYPLTQNSPKCLTLVNEKSILERLVISLKQQGFKRLVIVTGFLENCIREFLGTKSGNMTIEYIYSPLYKTTNNIYSLWLAGKMIDEPFLLIESDLVFQPERLKPMLQADRIAVSKMLPWMNGTTVTLNDSQQLDAFWLDTVNCNESSHFKTVNIYSFSRRTWRLIWERLDQHVSAKKVEGYYESVFAEMVSEGTITFAPVFFDADRWYEIDTHEDLSAAEEMFSGTSVVPVDIGKSLLPLRKPVSIRSPDVVDMKQRSIQGEAMRPSLSLVTSN